MRVQNSGTTKHQVAVYESQVAKLRAEVKKNYLHLLSMFFI